MFQVTSHGLPKEKLAKEWRSKDESEARKLMMWKKEEEKREKSKARKAFNFVYLAAIDISEQKACGFMTCSIP